MYVYINNLNVFIYVAKPLEEIATLMKENVPRIIYLTCGQNYNCCRERCSNRAWQYVRCNFLVCPPLHILILSTQRSCTTLVSSFKTICLVYQMAATYNSVVGDICQYLVSYQCWVWTVFIVYVMHAINYLHVINCYYYIECSRV